MPVRHESFRPPSSRQLSGRARLLPLLGLLGGAALVVGLAWVDVLPGGWRLRTMFVPQAVQDIRRRAAHRAERLAVFEAEPTPDPGGTLFIGSSTIERFPLDRLLQESKPINRGIGDEDLAGLEARALKTARRTRPRTVVLYAGSVNVRRAVDDGSWTEPEEIVKRAEALAGSLLELDSVASVVLLGILPEQKSGATLKARLNETNAGLSRLVEAPGIHFLVTARPELVDQEGNLRPEIAADRLHLNIRGYEVLARSLRPLLERLR